MGCFVSVEMIDELLKDRRALDIIKRLKKGKKRNTQEYGAPRIRVVYKRGR